MLARDMFDAVLFDAGGVLVLPDPTVLAPLLAPYGGATDIAAHRRAHYAAMAAKSARGDGEMSWQTYNDAYVASVGVDPELRAHAADVLDRTRTPVLWRWPIPESVAALTELAKAGVPMGVVSNASGQIEAELVRGKICQVGAGACVAVRVVVDSTVVGVAKPDPAIFEHALAHFDGVARARIAYVGDSVTIDVAGARAAGLHAVLLDPHDDHADHEVTRIGALADLLPVFGAG
jgi:putative hydrolase of the HAD superfamily